MNRRGFLKTILATSTAPAIIRLGSLMPLAVPKIIVPNLTEETFVLTLEQMHLETFVTGSSIRKIYYWPARVSDSNLITLSAR